MKLVTFHRGDGTLAPGALLAHPDTGLVSILDAAHPDCGGACAGLPASLQGWIEHGLEEVCDRIRDAAPRARTWLALADTRLAAPLPRPGKIVGAAFNYVDALRERDMKPPPEPVIFIKTGRAVVGPGDAIVLPAGLGRVTYEAELAVVIGRPALKVGRDQAMSHVAAYTLFNDVSASDLVKADGGFVRGKNQPTSGPLGPWLATPDEIPDPYALELRLDIDGRTLQRALVSNILFDIAALIEYASARMPLDPGDVIATGTPAGTASAHQPPEWLRPGSTVSVESAPLGRLDNPVRAEET